MLLCCVCKARKAGRDVQHFDPNFPDETSNDVISNRWASTREKTSVSGMRVNYKLFECLRREFPDPGFLCSKCHDLLEQIDSLQFQANELIRTLRLRIDHCAAKTGGGNTSDGHSEAEGNSDSNYMEGEDSGDEDSRDNDYDSSPSFSPSPVKIPKLTSPTKISPSPTKISLTRVQPTVNLTGLQPSVKAEPRDLTFEEMHLQEEDTFFEDTEFVPVPAPKIRKLPVVKKVAVCEAAKTPNRTPRLKRERNEFWDNCNDEDYVESILGKKNFDYDIQHIETITGQQHIICEGAIWHQHFGNKAFKTDKFIKKWICRWGYSNSYHCPAAVATTVDVDAVIGESKYLEHTHELDPEEVRYMLMKHRAREVALNHPELGPKNVLETVLLMDADFQNCLTGKKEDTVLKYIRDVKKKAGDSDESKEPKRQYRKRSEFWDKCNDEDYVQSVVDKNNLEYNIQHMENINSNPHIVYHGAIWHQHTCKTFKTDKFIKKWICRWGYSNSRGHNQCDAMVATTVDVDAVIVESKYLEHNHVLDPEGVKFMLLKHRAREVALNHPELLPKKVFETVLLMDPDFQNCLTGNEGRKESTVLKYIMRVQDKHGIVRKPKELKPQTPRTRKPLDKWKKTPAQIKAEAVSAIEGSEDGNSTPAYPHTGTRVMHRNEFWDNCNEEAYAQEVLAKQNFDYNLQHLENNLGNLNFIYEGEIWQDYGRAFATDKLLTKWICSKSHGHSYRCKARVATTVNVDAVIVESKYMEHNHDPDPEDVKQALLRDRVRKITKNHPEMSASKIIDSVLVMDPDLQASSHTKRKALLKLIQRAQDKLGIKRVIPVKKKGKGSPRKRIRKKANTTATTQKKKVVKKPIVLQPGQVYLQQRPDGTTIPITVGEDNMAYEMHYV